VTGLCVHQRAICHCRSQPSHRALTRSACHSEGAPPTWRMHRSGRTGCIEPIAYAAGRLRRDLRLTAALDASGVVGPGWLPGRECVVLDGPEWRRRGLVSDDRQRVYTGRSMPVGSPWAMRRRAFRTGSHSGSRRVPSARRRSRRASSLPTASGLLRRIRRACSGEGCARA
jgi:hypothetical protein